MDIFDILFPLTILIGWNSLNSVNNDVHLDAIGGL